MDGRDWDEHGPSTGCTTACTCIGRLDIHDGLGQWVVDLADPDCPAHRLEEDT